MRFDPLLSYLPGTRLQLGISDLHRCALLYTDASTVIEVIVGVGAAVGGGRGDGGSNLKIKKVTRGYGALRNNWRRVQCNRQSYRDRVLEEDKYERVIISKGLES